MAIIPNFCIFFLFNKTKNSNIFLCSYQYVFCSMYVRHANFKSFRNHSNVVVFKNKPKNNKKKTQVEAKKAYIHSYKIANLYTNRLYYHSEKQIKEKKHM